MDKILNFLIKITINLTLLVVLVGVYWQVQTQLIIYQTQQLMQQVNSSTLPMPFWWICLDEGLWPILSLIFAITSFVLWQPELERITS